MNFHITTLGCKVNEYESQYYAAQLKKAGYTQDLNSPADICIINTCIVTNTAAAKSRQKINKAKKENPDALIVIVGCYSQSLDEEQRNQIDADIWVGASHKKDLPKIIFEAVEQQRKIDCIENVERFDEFENMPIAAFENQHRAFLKIQDGCNQFCSYCAIPLVRGRERNMDFSSAVENARKLSEKGHKEIVLTGIHTGRYKSENKDLSDLLHAMLEATNEDVTFRISSIEITEVSDKLIELMKNNPRVLPHLHIPIQSACNSVLKRMNRPYTVEYFKDRLDFIRNEIPEISVSTDVIAGFVMESDEEFNETYKNLEDLHFSFLHVFPYSKRDKTKAAQMKGHLNGTIIKERTKSLLDLSENLRQKDMERFNTIEVLVERKTEQGYKGYTKQYHPVLIQSQSPLSNRVTIQYDSIENGVYHKYNM